RGSGHSAFPDRRAPALDPCTSDGRRGRLIVEAALRIREGQAGPLSAARGGGARLPVASNVTRWMPGISDLISTAQDWPLRGISGPEAPSVRNGAVGSTAHRGTTRS